MMKNIKNKVLGTRGIGTRKLGNASNSRVTTPKPYTLIPNHYSSGYTLLFAMIVASVVLAIGVSILTVSRKEFVLSSSATHSTNSFYAADSGIGCAEYWDNSSSENFSTS